MPVRIGPSEMVIIAFPDNGFNGKVASSFFDILDKGLIRVIDLVVVSKNDQGDAEILEVQDIDDEVATALAALTGEASGLLSEEDIAHMLPEVPDNSTVIMLLFEHLWLGEFAKNVRESGGEVVLSERIPGLVMEAARSALLEAAGN